MKGKLFHGNNKRCRKKADVSIATVSNYLNRTKPVSKELGARIQNAVDELGYSLNLNAKILKTAQYMDIGVILPSLNDSYYVQLFKELRRIFKIRTILLIWCFPIIFPNWKLPLLKI